MDVKDAVNVAVKYVQEVFGSEKLSNLGLEEVELASERNEWIVTVGFSRPWDYPKKKESWHRPLLLGPEVDYEKPPERDYKIVRIDDATGRVLSIKSRLLPELVEA